MDRPTREKSGRLIVVNYHHVRPAPDPEFPHLHGLTLEQFRRQLDTLARRFEMVAPEDVEAAIRGDGALPDIGCLLTFDDGLRDHAEHVLPELQRRGLRACFFVCTAPYARRILLTVHCAHLLSGRFGYLALREELVEAAREAGAAPPGPETREPARRQYRYDDPETAEVKFYLNFVLTAGQRERALRRVFRRRLGEERPFAERHYLAPEALRELQAAGMTVGLHSHRHLPLAAVPGAVMREDLAANARWLERLTGRWARWISYPYGGPDACSAEVAAAAERLGLRVGLTMTRRINRQPLAPMRIGRLDTNDAPGGKSPVALESLECASGF